MNTQTLRNDTDLHQILAIAAAVFATAGGLIHLTVTRQHLDFPAPDPLGGRESQVAEHRPRDLIERVRSLAPSATGGAIVWAGDRGGTTSPIAARAAAAYNGTQSWRDVVCYTCGCKLPYEGHGDPANLIEDHLVEAGGTETIRQAGVRTAKENMLELLQMQKDAGDLESPKADYNESSS